MNILTVTNLQKTFTTRLGYNQVKALKNISFAIEEGEYVAIMGESGSGKSTLLNIVASLDTPTSGTVTLYNQNIHLFSDQEISAFRRDNLGFVFQEFNLLDTFSIKDNILLPLVLANQPYQLMEDQLLPLTNRLGITKLLNKFPYEVSGGEKQRTAVARALITKPKLLLADEPTGALDSKSADQLLNIFSSINIEGQTILMVTHSAKAASHASRVLFIKDGLLYHQLYRGNLSNQQFFQRISDTITTMNTGDYYD